MGMIGVTGSNEIEQENAMTKDCNYYVNEFVDGLREQERGIWENLGRPYVRKQEARYEKAVAKLKETEEGMTALAGLLTHNNAEVALTTAVYLLGTSVEMEAVETFRRYADSPQDDFVSFCARRQLEEWEKSKNEPPDR